MLIKWRFNAFDSEVAYIIDGKEISYREMNSRIKCISRILYNANCSMIGLLLDRTENLLPIICACLTCGYTFVPIDPQLPHNRIEYILNNSKVDLVITNRNHMDVYSETFKVLSVEDTVISDFIFSDCLQEYCEVKHSVEGDVSRAAYVIYTSGSTGMPKGVEIGQEALMNMLSGVGEYVEFLPKKRMLSTSPISFDMFFAETILPLHYGATVVMANDLEYKNPKHIANLIKKYNVTMLQMTPSKLQMLLNYDKSFSLLENISDVMVGGECLKEELLVTIKKYSKAKIYNMYGPTEAAVWVSICNLTYNDNIHLGSPIKNVGLYVIDDNGKIVNNHQSGEIVITGKNLANKYINDTKLTKEKFIQLFDGEENIRAYRTGDIGRFDNDILCFLGRKDNQIKIRGYRVELEEIESLIASVPGIKASAVIATQQMDGDVLLCAFIVEDVSVSDKDIRAYLGKYLPEYMIPMKYYRVDKLMYTFNGKVDRKLLEKRVDELKTSDFTMLFENEDKEIFSVIAKNIDKTIFDAISMETDFCSIGIDSITFIKIVVALENTFDFVFDDEKLLLSCFPTVKSMIEYVKQKRNH